MNKKQYLAELEQRLKSLPEQERRDALEYYEGYLNDAGKQSKKAMEELGTPKEVAAQILAEHSTQPDEATGKPKGSGPKTALAVILAIFAAPIALPLAIAAFSIIFALLVTLFALIIAFGAAGIAMLIAAVVYIPVTIIAFTQAPIVGLAVLGACLLLIGLGILFIGFTILMARAGFATIARLAGKTILRKKAQ